MNAKKGILLGGFVFIFCLGLFTGNYAKSIYNHAVYYLNNVKGRIDAYSSDLSEVPVLQLNFSDKHSDIKFLAETFPVKIQFQKQEQDKYDKPKATIWVEASQAILGVKQFSLHNPESKGFLTKWFFHRVLEKEGFKAPVYTFVRLNLNEKTDGLYAFEQYSINESLVQNNSTFKLTEDSLWLQLAKYGFDSTMQASQVFDTTITPKLLALCELLGVRQHLIWNSVIFFYNSKTKLIEPIGYESPITEDIDNIIDQHFISFSHKHKNMQYVMSDTVLSGKFIQWANYYTQASFLSNVKKEMKDDIENYLSVLHTEWPMANFSTMVWEQNRKLIQLALSPPLSFYAFLKDTAKNEIKIELDNITKFPIAISALIVNDSIYSYPTEKIILLHNSARTTFSFPISSTLDNTVDIKLEYHLLGLDSFRKQSVFPFPRTL